MSPLVIMLLASLGPVLAGFDMIEDDEDDEAPEETVEAEESDPITTVRLEAFLEDARSNLGDTGPFNVDRGTDAVQDFVGLEDQSNIFDTSGGNDAITGGMLDDTLIGGEDSDTITGGDGDDAIFGGFHCASRDDDFDADVLDGGAGDDALFLGNGDRATGGDGADVFVTVQDADDATYITDFNADEDSLVVEAVNPEELSVTGQSVTEEGLVITLSNGATISLAGLTEAVAPDIVRFMDVDPLLSNVWT